MLIWRLAVFFFDSAIPFDGVKSFYFQQMVDAISAISPGYEVPTYQDMRGRILKKVLEEVKSHIQTYRKYWASLGCTIMVDGWSDGRGMTLINFLVYCPKGTVFLRSVNASEIVESAESMYALFKEVVEEVGVNNVVQIITDNVESYAIAGNMLCETYPSIFWSPCAARCIDLILFKIGEIEEVKKVIRTAREITKFIYNHATVLNMMRKFTNGKELVWPSSTRSATNFLTLQSMVAQKDGLRAMVTSKDWLDSAYAKKSNGTLVVDILLDSHFWTSCTQVIRYTEPLLRVLRMVDSEQRPAMGYIYEAMLRVKDAIRIAFKSKKSDYMPIWDIVDSQWDRQLQRPLHAAGYVLNPACFFSPGFSDDHPGVTTGILDCIERLVSGQRNHDKVIKELNVYKSSGGDFGRSMAIRARNTMLPSDWWSTFGGQCPNLKRLAMRVLSQTCSASGYECDWSVFVRMHTTKSNRLEHKRLTDLVFVHYNLRLRQRENAKMKLIDPIALENIDTSEEWVVEFEPSMLEGDDDMDWMTLDRPIVGEDIPLELMSMEVGDGNTQVEQLGEEEDGTDIQ
ncbi:uncharacterized protein LOC18431604 [Amborella trichopoda]|uniref:uncharacterized protein LOC18431604 n=1 Tax=Amborella trichopoda TaxID=13333 RepID=UPI0005D2F41D|nr:uncharacterized protein LOC18431604 [Amborella trichopoda]|eukprot:XP_020521171.1 uncharacterized protein LOC18431604 [Amborella trichopoda]